MIQERPPRVRRVGRAIAVLLCVALAGVALMAVLATRTPSWWVPPAADDPEVRALGERVEQRLVEEATRIRDGGGEWAIRLTEEQANAWLAGRLPQWLAHADGQSGASAPVAQVHFETDRMVVAIAPFDGTVVASSAFQPTVTEGMLSVADLGGGVGSLRLPFFGAAKGRLLELLAAAVADASESESDHFASLLRAFGGDPVAARVDLGDGRTLELLDLEIADGEIRIAARTAMTTPPPR